MNLKDDVIYKVAIGLIILDVLTALYAVIYGSYPPYLIGGGDPSSYLIIYLHIPVAWNMYFAFTLALIGSILFLWKGMIKYDVLSYAAVVLGVLYGFAALTTGILWANEVWGSPWNWDPRQTSVLILLLAYAGYIALRFSITDIERARVFSASYAIAAYVTLPLSYFSAILFRSLHQQLPKQPLNPDIYSLLFLRVVIAFVSFAFILLLYYRKSKDVLSEVSG
jgi:ABC-type transport system involved in cytochrome c biogenesis permease subunit